MPSQFSAFIQLPQIFLPLQPSYPSLSIHFWILSHNETKNLSLVTLVPPNGTVFGWHGLLKRWFSQNEATRLGPYPLWLCPSKRGLRHIDTRDARAQGRDHVDPAEGNRLQAGREPSGVPKTVLTWSDTVWFRLPNLWHSVMETWAGTFGEGLRLVSAAPKWYLPPCPVQL